MMDVIEGITITRHEDGRLTVDGFPELIAVSTELLLRSDRRFLRPEAGMLHITVSNGRADYRIEYIRHGLPSPDMVWVCRKIRSEQW